MKMLILGCLVLLLIVTPRYSALPAFPGPPCAVTRTDTIQFLPFKRLYKRDDVVESFCLEGYSLKGANRSLCSLNGWEPALPTCEEISCTEPEISNGKVRNPKPKYLENEQLSFQCNNKYKPSKSADVYCTKNGWNPEPYCEEISCYPKYVANGKVVKLKDVYKAGETIELVCDYGYRIEFSPNEPRTCTKNDWSPPLACISLRCDRPYIENGDVYGGNYYYSFPRRANSEIDYRCKEGYLTARKVYNERTRCTENGWSPKPKCTRSCSGSDAAVTNGWLERAERVYLSGEKVGFTCNPGYFTPDRKNHGERECLPNGGFTEAKCSREYHCLSYRGPWRDINSSIHCDVSELHRSIQLSIDVPCRH